MPDRAVAKANRDRAPATKKPYATPRIEQELEMETRAGSPLFEFDQSTGEMKNPWDPEYSHR